MRPRKEPKYSYIREPEYYPVYKANREWTKDFKFNGRWYNLSSVYDDQEFDFNLIQYNDTETAFDFNQVLYETE